jgi:CheY-like chemotaxis protein
MVVHSRQEAQPVAVAVKVAEEIDAEPSLVGIKVLIIDDAADTRDLLRAVLERYGAHVRVAGSAAQGLAEAKEWNPSIVVSDIGMPLEDGYDFIRKFREWEISEGKWTPAVALTAYARGEDRRRVLAAGFQIHIPKPIEPTELALVVASQLGRSR